MQTKVRKKALVVVKQDGATNLADIGTKSLAGPRFAQLRDAIGRVALDVEAKRAIEQKASVGMVTAAGGKMVESSALAALAVFLSMIKQAAANPEECDTDFSGKLVQYKVVDTTGFDVSGKALLMMMAVIFLIGFGCGCALACRCMRMAKSGRTVQTQSQVRYTLETAVSRFQPLPEYAQGA